MHKLKLFFITLFVGLSGIIADDFSTAQSSANTIISVMNGESSVRCLTPNYIDIVQNGHLLSQSIKAELEKYGFNFSEAQVKVTRPTLDSNYDTDHFRIHYSTTGSHAVDPSGSDGDTHPDYVETMGTVFEDVYNHEINVMGFTPPPSDGNDGGSNAYDIYIENLGSNAYGWTVFGDAIGDNEKSTEIIENNAYTSYIKMNRNYDGFPHTEIENIQVTAGHEFFHSIQMGYDSDEAIWLMEATAVWMEEETYDDVNDCYQYMIPRFEKPHVSLTSASGLIPYGSYIFFKYIDEHLGGPAVIKRTWEQSRLLDSSMQDFSIVSVDRALNEGNHSFKKALNNMVIANRILSFDDKAGNYSYEESEGYRNYEQASKYGGNYKIELATYDSLTFTKGFPDTITSLNLQKYASQYIKLNSVDPVKINLNAGDNTNITDLNMHTISKNTDGNYIVQSGHEINIDPLDNTDWIYVAIVSSGTTGKDWNYKIKFEDGISYQNSDFMFNAPYPNPFNSTISIGLMIFESQSLDISIVDILGRHMSTVHTGQLNNGSYNFNWDGKSDNGSISPTGVYYISILGTNRQEWKKITLIR